MPSKAADQARTAAPMTAEPARTRKTNAQSPGLKTFRFSRLTKNPRIRANNAVTDEVDRAMPLIPMGRMSSAFRAAFSETDPSDVQTRIDRRRRAKRILQKQ